MPRSSPAVSFSLRETDVYSVWISFWRQITVVRFMKMVLNWFVERGQEMEVKHWKTRGGLRGGRWTGDGGGGLKEER